MSERAQSPVVIVGGGYSGAMLAVRLLRLGQRVVLVERAPAQLGLGVAYRTERPEHLLNVRAANMAAFGDEAAHFTQWLGIARDDPDNHFIPRMTYGRYLRAILAEAVAAHAERAAIIEGEAIALHRGPGGLEVELAGGARLAASAVVLAVGNFPPSPLSVFAGLPRTTYRSDPWEPGALTSIGMRDHVLLIGSGLTAVDVTMTLLEQGFAGRITALSRRGLRPTAHATAGPVPSAVPMPGVTGSWLIRSVRRRAAQVGWREAVDELRPHTQALWRSHDIRQQRRFLRHLRPYWDVHRHRIAPHVSARLAEMEASGRLRFVAGKVAAAAVRDGRAIVDWRPRGSGSTDRLVADHIVGCTGPEADIDRADHPLIRQLRAAGLVRPDSHRIGLDVDRHGRLRDVRGQPHDHIYAIGPLTKGEAWETVAVPDIRERISDLADQILAPWSGTCPATAD